MSLDRLVDEQSRDGPSPACAGRSASHAPASTTGKSNALGPGTRRLARTKQIRQVFDESRQRYGSPRVKELTRGPRPGVRYRHRLASESVLKEASLCP